MNNAGQGIGDDSLLPMLRPRYVRTIAWKELVDSLRDWRTLIVMVGLPIVLYPLLMIGTSQLIMFQQRKIREDISRICIVDEDHGTALIERLKVTPGLEVVPQDSSLRDATKLLASEERPPNQTSAGPGGETGTAQIADILTSRKIDLILFVEEGFEAAINAGKTGCVQLFLDEADERSRNARKRVEQALAEFGDEIVEQRLALVGHSRGFIEPVNVVARNVASPERMGGSLTGQFLPYVLVLLILVGAMYPAMDLTAGEKERKTMETLLVSPATRFELVCGKYVAVFVIAFVTALLNLASLTATLTQGLPLGQLEPGTTDPSNIISFSVSPWVIVGVLVFVVPVTGLFAGLSMALCAFARTYKEAQLYLLPITLATALPAILSSLPGVELTYGLSLVPVTNVTLLFREVLSQKPMVLSRVIMGVLTFLSTTVYAYAALRIAARVFEGEGVLLPSAEAPRFSFWFLQMLRRGAVFPRREVATPEQAVMLLAVVFLLHFYVAPHLIKSGVRGGIAGTQLGLVLLPTLLAAYFLRVKPETGLGVVRPDLRGLMTAPVIGLLTFVASFSLFVLQSIVMPPPQTYFPLFERILAAEGLAELLLIVLIAAILPGVCEELLFRGLFQHAWERRVGSWRAIVIGTIAFGALHLDIYRLLPVCLIGLASACICWRTRSVVPAMIVHIVNNLVVVVLMFLSRRGYIPGEVTVPVPAAGLLLILSCLLGWRLIRRLAPQRRGTELNSAVRTGF